MVSYIPNYKTAISDKITCWEGEQFPLTRAEPVLGAERTGLGGVLELGTPPPRLTRLLGHVATRGKLHSSVRDHDETTSVIFYVRSRVRSPEAIKGQILRFSTFSDKSANNSGTRRVKTPQ